MRGALRNVLKRLGATETAIMAATCLAGFRLGGLISYSRRLTAQPFCGVFFLAISRINGVIASIALTSITPFRNSQELLTPTGQSANLFGVAHPLGGGVSNSLSLSVGECHEC